MIRSDLKQLSLVSAFLVTFSFIPYITQKEPAIAAEKDYPQNFATAYVKDCVSEASKHKEAANFIKADAFQELCNCTLNQFQSKYNFSQYQSLSWEEKQKEGFVCVKKMIFE
jgi:hypothetical protein